MCQLCVSQVFYQYKLYEIKYIKSHFFFNVCFKIIHYFMYLILSWFLFSWKVVKFDLTFFHWHVHLSIITKLLWLLNAYWRNTYLSTTTIGPFWYSKCHTWTISNNLINEDNSRTEYLLCINLTGSIKSSCTDWITRSLVSKSFPILSSWTLLTLKLLLSNVVSESLGQNEIRESCKLDINMFK